MQQGEVRNAVTNSFFILYMIQGNCENFGRSFTAERYASGLLSFAPLDESTASAVVDELALLLTGGRLNANSRAAIEATYSSTKASDGTAKALKMAQKLIINTPEFHSTSVFRPLGEARPEPAQPPEPTNPYKALVYVNLDGGLDSFNMLVPHSNCNRGTFYFSLVFPFPLYAVTFLSNAIFFCIFYISVVN